MSGNINQNFDLNKSSCPNCDSISATSNKCGISCYNGNSKDSTSNTNLCQTTSLQTDPCYSSSPRLNTNVLNNYISDSDSSDSVKCFLSERTQIRKKKLPPIGVFWDIENCQVPKGRSAMSVARLIRDKFFKSYREAEFVVVCDVKKESSQIIQELNDAQVTLIHVSSTCKNAADEKLRQALRRFADTYSSPAAVVLISGDINFAADLSDLRHRKKLHVILIHKDNAADALILCASEHHSYTDITQDLPVKEVKSSPGNGAMEVTVRNLPKGFDSVQLRNRLKQLSDNCGGRVVSVSSEMGTAVVRFNNLDLAVRAQRRMDGEDVYGCKISVSYPSSVRNWDKSFSPYKYAARKITKNPDPYLNQTIYGMPPPNFPVLYSSMDYFTNLNNIANSLPPTVHKTYMDPSTGAILKNQQDSSSQCNVFFKYHQPSQINTPPKMELFPTGRSIRGANNSIASIDFTSNEHWRRQNSPFNDRYRRSRTPVEVATGSKRTLNRNFSGSFTALHTLNHEFTSEEPYCSKHCPNGLGLQCSWINPEIAVIPHVRFRLKMFSTRVHNLLHSHMGVLPLSSFAICYEIDIGEKLPIDESGVPLEHLITCVTGVELRVSSKMIKNIVWATQNSADDTSNEGSSLCGGTSSSSSTSAIKCASPPISAQIIDLLKTAPKCQMLLSKFVPVYHHRYGRQYRLSDYGHTKLLDLIESVPQVAQIIGEGPSRVITLTHSAQIRRFNLDLVKVLRGEASKQVRLAEFPVVYERVFSRPFNPVDYGLCELTDLLDTVPEHTALVKTVAATDVVITLPRREQTPAELRRTKKFALEVVDLLKQVPYYTMLFNKFIPAYHQHFGHQCRLADYGFTKLIELFEAIPEVVKVEGMSEGERQVSLTPKEALKVVCQQIITLVRLPQLQCLPFGALSTAFLRENGYPLRPELYNCVSNEDLISKLSDTLHLESGLTGPVIVIKEECNTQEIGLRIWTLLLDHPHTSSLSTILKSYHFKFGQQCTLQQLEKYQNILKVIQRPNCDDEVTLTPRYIFATRLYHLLFENGGSLLLGNIDGMYLRKFGRVLRPTDYEAVSLNALLTQLPFLVVLKGRRNKRTVFLNHSISAFGVPLPSNTAHKLSNTNGNISTSNSIQWPQPPSNRTYLFSTKRSESVSPKVDCLPTYTPPIENQGRLISPIESFFQAFSNEARVKAPDPSELPMPSPELLNKSKTMSPTKDSSISSNNFSAPVDEPDSKTLPESGNVTPKKKRHSRLAAHFKTPLNLT